MRMFFHAINGAHEIRDLKGITVTGLEHARTEILQALEEFQDELAASVDGLSGWMLNVVDASGSVVFTLDLGGLQLISRIC